MSETPAREPVPPALDAAANDRDDRPDGDDRIDAYDYELPEHQIARRPVATRDGSRLLAVDRRPRSTADRAGHDHRFRDLPGLLGAGDLLVVNDCQVIPARLAARRRSGGRVEVLLHPTGIEASLTAEGGHRWQALLRPSARLRRGELLQIGEHATLRIEDDPGPELRTVSSEQPLAVLLAAGEVPLPPYLERDADDEDERRYQTVYARQPGAIAAPTAGLHFTDALLETLRTRGIETAPLTLFVGPGTFLPVRSERLSEHDMHEEAFEIPESTAQRIARTREAGHRVIAVGTTTTRALEAAADGRGGVHAGARRTRLMIRPPHRFQVVDGLVTNFHLPRSTLLALVAAFCGREHILEVYRGAVARGYRFYSYGDAMLIL